MSLIFEFGWWIVRHTHPAGTAVILCETGRDLSLSNLISSIANGKGGVVLRAIYAKWSKP